MKTNKLFLGMTLLAAGLTSCSSDAPMGPEHNQTVDCDQTRFIAIEITAPRADVKGTRAFEDGTTDESAVSRIDFFFYDVSGNPTGTPMTFSGDALTSNGASFSNGPYENGNVTRIWTSVVPVYLTQGQNLPSYVMCLVNATDNQVNGVKSKPMSELRDLESTDFISNNFFIMSNSVYYGKNELTGESDQRISATPIDANTQLYTTSEQAQNAIKTDGGTGLLNVYVERVAAKVGLTLGEGAVKDYTLANGDAEGQVTLTFVPQYWFMNAVADEEYITKRYVLKDGDKEILYPEYSQINEAFATSGMATTWNSEEDHRSYWGCSPSYWESEYPLVSDQVDDLYGNIGDYPVTYYSYNQIAGSTGEASKTGLSKQAIAANNGLFATTNTGASTTGYIYSRETTTASTILQDVTKNPAATVASAVVVGKYKVNGEVLENNASFFIDPNDGANGTYYGSTTTAIAALIKRQHIVFSDNQGNNVFTDANSFRIQHPRKAVRDLLANPNIAGQLVALQLTLDDLGEGQKVYYYDPEATTGNGFVQITAANLAKVNAQLIQAGYMNSYAQGLAFFNIPIRHLGFDVDNAGNALYADGKYNWAKMKIGDLGLVRNHVYNINVTTIGGIGTGLRNPDQPIVPSKEEVNQYIAMRLNILAWNVVNSWSVSF